MRKSIIKNEKDRKAIIGFVLLTIVVISIAMIQFMLAESGKVNEQTLCPLDGAKKSTVILIDKSDKWDSDDVVRIREWLTNLYSNISANDRLTMVAITGKGRDSTEVNNLFDKCNPGSEKECNALYQNCRRIMKRYKESFGEQLAEIRMLLEKPGESSFSPLFETLVQIIDDNETPELDIHLVSDLMENGANFRFYDQIPLSDAIVAEYPISSTSDIQVYAHIEERRRHSRNMINAVESVWRQYLEQQGITAEFKRLLIAD